MTNRKISANVRNIPTRACDAVAVALDLRYGGELSRSDAMRVSAKMVEWMLENHNSMAMMAFEAVTAKSAE